MKPLLPVKSEKPDEKNKPMTSKGIAAAASYMACAVMLVLFNKAALSSYKFPCTNVLTLLQMIIGMASIRGVNVPIYTTLRRTTVVFTLVMERFISGQRHSLTVISSVIIIVFGALVSGYSDLSFDLYSYGVVFLSNVTTAIYLAIIARLGKSLGLNSFGLMWANGIICIPLLFLCTLIDGELVMTMNFSHLNEIGFRLIILMSCILAFGLNYTIFLNTNLNSALTQTMCGNLKDLGTVGIGWVLFGGLPFNLANIFGQALGFIGSGLYAYCKLNGV